MTHGLPNAALAELYSTECATELYGLVTVSHVDLASTLRFVDRPTDFVSRGDTFQAFPMQIRLPRDREGELQTASIVVCAVDRQVIQAVRTISSEPDIVIELVRSAAPDVPIREFRFVCKLVRWSAREVEFELSAEALLEEPYPGLAYTPLSFPAMFDR